MRDATTCLSPTNSHIIPTLIPPPSISSSDASPVVITSLPLRTTSLRRFGWRPKARAMEPTISCTA